MKGMLLENGKTCDNQTYSQIKEILTTARAKAYSAVNFAMVEAYWLIGKQIVARQKRFSFDGRDFYIDLVFYHYILKCFVGSPAKPCV